jgi:hypothetical protein
LSYFKKYVEILESCFDVVDMGIYHLGITKMSRGSSTKVGSYAEKRKCPDRQFKINDMTVLDEEKKRYIKKAIHR